MFTRPAALPDSTVLAAVQSGWGFHEGAVDYLAAGFGSHHWVGTNDEGSRLFLTVDDLASREFLGYGTAAAFAGLTSALAVTASLHRHGLDWVVAPLADADGQLLRWLDEKFSIAAFPYLDGVATGEYADAAERADVVSLLAALHQVPAAVHASARSETFRLLRRSGLAVALESLDGSWNAGPYGEPARALLRQHAGDVRRSLAAYDRLASAAIADQRSWTITHGEPHSSNVMRTREGLRVIDWDTALRGPPERDLWMLCDPAGTDAAARQYAELTGHRVEPDLLRLYALWWDLSEVGSYVSFFVAPHLDTEDAKVSWHGLQTSLRGLCERQ